MFGVPVFTCSSSDDVIGGFGTDTGFPVMLRGMGRPTIDVVVAASTFKGSIFAARRWVIIIEVIVPAKNNNNDWNVSSIVKKVGLI